MPKKKSDNATDIAIVIDASGSMSTMQDEVITGVNKFIDEQKLIPGKAFVTIVVFNHSVSVTAEREPLEEFEGYLDKDNYAPCSTTALYDAVAVAIKEVEKHNKNNKAIVAIITDGQENASQDMTHESITKLIDEKKELGWEFIFLASKIDAKATGADLHIRNSFQYEYSSEGIKGNRGVFGNNGALYCTVTQYRTED